MHWWQVVRRIKKIAPGRNCKTNYIVPVQVISTAKRACSSITWEFTTLSLSSQFFSSRKKKKVENGPFRSKQSRAVHGSLRQKYGRWGCPKWWCQGESGVEQSHKGKMEKEENLKECRMECRSMCCKRLSGAYSASSYNHNESLMWAVRTSNLSGSI